MKAHTFGKNGMNQRKRFKRREVDTTAKVAFKLNHKTTVYASADSNIEDLRARYGIRA